MGSPVSCRISVTISVESMPPDKNAPTGTSATIWRVTARSSSCSVAARRSCDVHGWRDGGSLMSAKRRSAGSPAPSTVTSEPGGRR